MFSWVEIEHIACQLFIFTACARPSDTYASNAVDRIAVRDFGITDFRSAAPGVYGRNRTFYYSLLVAAKQPLMHRIRPSESRSEISDFGWLVDHGKNSVNLRGTGAPPVIELSRYVLEALRKDEEFILYRGRSKDDASQVLVLSPLAENPAPEILKSLEHAYPLRDELDLTWATRPIAMVRYWDRTVLVLEDPGGVPLSHLFRSRLRRFRRTTGCESATAGYQVGITSGD